jgi:hypothetical protein
MGKVSPSFLFVVEKYDMYVHAITRGCGSYDFYDEFHVVGFN